MASTSASPQPWFRSADAVRRILNSVFGRRVPQAPGPGFNLPNPPGHTAGLAPEMTEALEWMEQRIKALADRDKLDDGHGAILEPAVDTMVELWGRVLDAEHRAHQARLEWAELDLTARASWLQREADRADARITAVDNELTRLSGPPEEPGQSEQPEQSDGPASPDESTEEAT